MADTPVEKPKAEDPPKDPEIEKLQKELDKETLLAKIAEQKKNALAASLPPTSVTALEGKTELDEKVLIEAQILAYRMLDTAATQIANEVTTKVNGAIVVHNSADLAALGAYRTFAGQMGILADNYNAIAPQADAPKIELASAIVGVTAAVKTVIDLVALFRTDRKIEGVAIDIMDLALVSEVAGKLAAKKRKVYISELYPLGIQTEPGKAVQDYLDRVRNAAVAAALRVQNLSAAPAKEEAAARLKALDTIRASFDDLLTRVAAEGSVLATLVRGAAVETFLAKGNVLYLKVLKAGGTNETAKNLLGSKVLHSGGVIVNYILFDIDGSVLLASTVNAYSGEMKDVPK